MIHIVEDIMTLQILHEYYCLFYLKKLSSSFYILNDDLWQNQNLTKILLRDVIIPTKSSHPIIDSQYIQKICQMETESPIRNFLV